MFKSQIKSKIIVPKTPNGGIGTDQLADGAVTREKLGVHLYEHTIYTMDSGSFTLINTDPTEYVQVKDLPEFLSTPMAGTNFDGYVAIKCYKTGTGVLSKLTIVSVYVENGVLAEQSSNQSANYFLRDEIRVIL